MEIQHLQDVKVFRHHPDNFKILLNKGMDNLQLNGGVIVIGSLYWEKTPIRKNWMIKCLDQKNEKHISLPIRYGRVSPTRNCTYTMVFSDECKMQDKIGKAIAIPFVNNPVDGKRIEALAKAMIDAEHNEVVDFKRYNWNWGALALLVNPKHLSKDSDKYFMITELRKHWSGKFGAKFMPEDYCVGAEKPIINQGGELLIDWQEEVIDLDFLIATAIKPELREYPVPDKIAARIVVNEYDEYFRENLKSGITTFQDKIIIEILNKKP